MGTLKLNKQKLIPAALVALFAFTAAVGAQTVPPLPADNRVALRTVWPIAWNAQAVNTVQAAQIAALQTAVARLSIATVAPVATATRTSTPIPSATSTATPPPGATSTPVPAGTATQQPMPMPTVIGGVPCLNCILTTGIQAVPIPVPDIHNLACPAWAHDVWLTLAANGLIYRTWHPSRQPEDKPGAGCLFDHTHGPRDPRNSNADNTLPAYGYAADQHGMSEPHEGFKTFYANAGDRNEFENFSSTSDVKATFHQGTLGAGRVAQRFHTLEFDLKNANGAEVHVEGMGDTGFASNQCVPAAQVNTEQGTIGVRFFAMPRPLAASCGVGTPYEVWEWALTVPGADNRIHAKLGTFDAITVLNPSTGLLEQTSATWPNAPFSGCKADAYYGPANLNTNIDVIDAHGIRQVIKVGSVKNFPLDSVGKSAFKLDYDDCSNQPYTKN